MVLMSVEELAARLGDRGTIVCDVRFDLADLERGQRDHAAGHVPGARFVDLHTELAGGPGGGRHPLPRPGDFTNLLGRLGATPESSIVCYDDSGGAMAARMWWMLRSIGHRDAAVLDGGWPAWLRSGRPVESAPPVVEPTVFPAASAWSGTVDAAELDEALRGGVTVIDARSPERYRGDVEPIDPRAGHIPGALNLFHGDNLAADGTFLDPGRLAARFEGVGAEPIVYCGSGVTACSDLLAMAVAGMGGGRLYPGSWSEWCSDPGRPVATGSGAPPAD